MRKYQLAFFVFIFGALPFQCLAAINYDLGVVDHPKRSRRLLMIHTDHYPTEEDMALAEGMYASVKKLIVTHKGFAHLPSNLWTSVVLSLKTAAFFGHPEALGDLADCASAGHCGVRIDERVWDAFVSSDAKDIWKGAKRKLAKGITPSTERLENLPGVVAGDLLKKQQAEAAAYTHPLSALGSPNLDGIEVNVATGETAPLLDSKGKGLRHRGKSKL